MMKIGHISRSTACYIASKTYDGYTLFTTLGIPGVWLIDMKGNIVHHWELSHDPGLHGVLLPNGNLLYAGELPDRLLQELGGGGGELFEIDWDGNAVWRYEDPYMHHDFQRLPNGNTMILRWVRTPDDIAAKIKGGVPGTENEDAVWADSFREITPDGKVVWEWLGYEHLNPETDAICPLCSRGEWTHINACFVLQNGDILTSFHRLNTIAIINKSTGAIKWRWGPGEIAHPHDPSMLDNGNILVFDNGWHRPATIFSYSRVLEVNLDGQVIWEFKEESPLHYYCSFISGCQRLPNGNTLICEGAIGRFIEVTPEKEIVWEYNCPFYTIKYPVVGLTNLVFRAHRYAPDYPGLKEKELIPDKFQLSLSERYIGQEKTVQKRLIGLGY